MAARRREPCGRQRNRPARRARRPAHAVDRGEPRPLRAAGRVAVAGVVGAIPRAHGAAVGSDRTRAAGVICRRRVADGAAVVATSVWALGLALLWLAAGLFAVASPTSPPPDLPYAQFAVVGASALAAAAPWPRPHRRSWPWPRRLARLAGHAAPCAWLGVIAFAALWTPGAFVGDDPMHEPIDAVPAPGGRVEAVRIHGGAFLDYAIRSDRVRQLGPAREWCARLDGRGDGAAPPRRDEKSMSRNARRAGAWIAVRGEADDRRRIGGFAKARPPVSGREDIQRLADCNPLHRVSWVLIAAGAVVSGLCVLCALRGSSLSQRQKQKGTTEDTENTKQSKPKGGSRAPGSCGARRAAWPFVAQTPSGRPGGRGSRTARRASAPSAPWCRPQGTCAGTARCCSAARSPTSPDTSP